MYGRVVPGLVEKVDDALRLEEVLRSGSAQQRVRADPVQRRQQVANGFGVAGAHELVAEHLVDARRGRVGADAAVPAPQLIERSRLDAPAWADMVHQQRCDTTGGQTDLVSLERAEIDGP